MTAPRTVLDALLADEAAGHLAEITICRDGTGNWLIYPNGHSWSTPAQQDRLPIVTAEDAIQGLSELLAAPTYEEA